MDDVRQFVRTMLWFFVIVAVVTAGIAASAANKHPRTTGAVLASFHGYVGGDTPTRSHPFTVADPGMVTASLTWNGSSVLTLAVVGTDGVAVGNATSGRNLDQDTFSSPGGASLVATVSSSSPRSTRYTLTITEQVTTPTPTQERSTSPTPPLPTSSSSSPAPNIAPAPTDDVATTQTGTDVTVPVLQNDTDPDGEPLTLAAVGAPSHGSAAKSGDAVTYAPTSGFAGTDSFTYQVCDVATEPACATGHVTVNVESPQVQGDVLTPFGVENESSGSITLSRALAQARAFRYITARPLTYRDFVHDMKQANPGLTIAAYVNGTFAQPAAASSMPEAWFSHDANGARITSNNWGNYLMNPTNAGWVQSRVDQCNHELSISGYDGCFIDMLGTEPLTFDYLSSTPINPATGQPWTTTQWLAATTHIGAAIANGTAPRPILVNGLGTGWRYFDAAAPTSRLFGSVDVAMAEGFTRGAGNALTLYRAEDKWRQEVDMIADAEAHGKRVLAYTKVWVSATQQQLDDLHRYALATFLLGTNGSSSFCFSPGPGYIDPDPWWSTAIGAPTGPYGKNGGVYQRTFTNGKVLVNPTTTAVTVSLGGTYTMLSGATLSTVVMAPHSGAILTKS